LEELHIKTMLIRPLHWFQNILEYDFNLFSLIITDTIALLIKMTALMTALHN